MAVADGVVVCIPKLRMSCNIHSIFFGEFLSPQRRNDMEKKPLDKKNGQNQGGREENSEFNNLMADANYDTYKARFDQ